MPAEIELKLGFPRYVESQWGVALTDAYGLPVTQVMHNRYYDTPDLALWNQRIAVRLRQKDAQWLLTVKGKGGQAGGLHERLEWEWPVEAPELDARRLMSTGLISETVVSALQPVFDTDFQRQVWHVTEAGGARLEIALDTGVIRAGDREARIAELEVELLEGEPAAIVGWAREWAGQFALWPATASKAQRGYVLAGLKAHPPETPLEHWAQWCQQQVAPFEDQGDWETLPRDAAEQGINMAAQVLGEPVTLPAGSAAWEALLSRVTRTVLDRV